MQFTHGDISSLQLLGLQLLTCPTFREIHKNERDRFTVAEQLAGDLEVWKGSFGAQGHHNGLGLRTLVERQTFATPILDAVALLACQRFG